jgi:cellulase/cellobiase CelA1
MPAKTIARTANAMVTANVCDRFKKRCTGVQAAADNKQKYASLNITGIVDPSSLVLLCVLLSACAMRYIDSGEVKVQRFFVIS